MQQRAVLGRVHPQLQRVERGPQVLLLLPLLLCRAARRVVRLQAVEEGPALGLRGRDERLLVRVHPLPLARGHGLERHLAAEVHQEGAGVDQARHLVRQPHHVRRSGGAVGRVGLLHAREDGLGELEVRGVERPQLGADPVEGGRGLRGGDCEFGQAGQARLLDGGVHRLLHRLGGGGLLRRVVLLLHLRRLVLGRPRAGRRQPGLAGRLVGRREGLVGHGQRPGEHGPGLGDLGEVGEGRRDEQRLGEAAAQDQRVAERVAAGEGVGLRAVDLALHWLRQH